MANTPCINTILTLVHIDISDFTEITYTKNSRCRSKICLQEWRPYFLRKFCFTKHFTRTKCQ